MAWNPNKRYGPFAAFIDFSDSFDDLLARLRQALQKVQLRLKKLHRFRHLPDLYSRDLEKRCFDRLVCEFCTCWPFYMTIITKQAEAVRCC